MKGRVLIIDDDQALAEMLGIVLRAEGLDHDPDFPQIQELIQLGLATPNPLRLTEEGLAWTDTIGPWLYSQSVQQLMQEYELR